MDKIKGSKGGSQDKVRTPIEDENTLQSRAIARFIDLIGEGEVEGLVDGEQSVYFDNVPIRNAADAYNFDGLAIEFKPGAPDHIPLKEYPVSESEISVETKIFVAGPLTKLIPDPDVDDVRLTFTIPSLFTVNSTNGDIKKTTVTWQIYIKPSGGNFIFVKELSKYGKCIAAYQTDYRISKMEETYGPGPWEIKVVRITPDSDTNSLQNDLYWSSYTQIINRVMIYPDSALIGVTLNSQQFGSRIPSRSYELYGLKIQVPSNYDPETREYTGIWDGTFQRAYSNNPAWIWYDLVNNNRYGLGLEAEYIDKWGLYTIAQYNDQLVDDGNGGEEPRFTFNGVLQSRSNAIQAMNMVASSMRAMPFWAGGQATLSQDSPKDSVKLVTGANVLSGIFTYTGSSLESRYTVCNVSWNDPDNYYKLTVEPVDDLDGINRYGYKPSDIVAVGCTSRGQAYRFGRWFLDTSLNEFELITYRASWDQADLLPGNIITVMDSHNVNTVGGGRIISVTANTCTLDRGVTLEIGETYSVTFIDPAGTLVERDVTTVSDDQEHTVLNLASSWPADDPQVDSVWILSASNVEPREFRVITNTEVEPNVYEISGVEYDPDKYARVEDGRQFDPPPLNKFPDANDPISAPTNFQYELYTYEDTAGSAAADRKFGVMLSWTHTRDTRFHEYEMQWKLSTGAYADNELIQTTDTLYDVRPIESGIYSFRVRAKGFGRESLWLTLSEINIDATVEVPPNITGLVTIDDPPTTFNGKDCEITWDELVLATDTTSEAVYDGTAPTYFAPFDSTLTKVKDYQIEVLTTGDVHLRYGWTTDNKWVYTFGMNSDDNGTPIRNLKFRLWARDIYEQLSGTPTVMTATNPQPSMSGLIPTVTDIYTGLKVDWSSITPTDNDMAMFRVYLDVNNPPTTLVAEVGVNTNYWVEPQLTPNTTYRAQIEPWDEFGAGVKSNIVNGSPLKIPVDDIEGELINRLVMSDSIDSSSASLSFLYDGDYDTAPFGYNSGDWIQYGFPIDQLLDRVTVWASGSVNCYFSTSLDGITYDFYKAEADHTLDANGRLLNATNEADAITNYWTADAGAGNNNTALFPDGLNMAYAKIHILTNGIDINELRFVDQVIAEWVVANELSAISANVGVLTSGLIQSGNLSATNGILMDLDNDRITMGGTTDEDIVFDGNTATITVTDSGSIEVGQLGTINVGADGEITVGERGRIVVGDDNIILDGNTNSIIVAPDGGQAGQNYAEFSAGELNFYYWYQGQHTRYDTVSRIESGQCNNNTWTTIPGIWKTTPKILVSPYQLQSYVGGRYNQSQIFDCAVTDIRLQSGHTQKWEFRARAQLVLQAGATGTTTVSYTCQGNAGTGCNTANVYPPPGTTTVSVTGRFQSYWASLRYDKDGYAYAGYTGSNKARIWLRVNGAKITSWEITSTKSWPNVIHTFTLNSGSRPISYFNFEMQSLGAASGDYANKYVTPTNWSRCYLDYYTGDIPGTSQLATGSLNWIAMGE